MIYRKFYLNLFIVSFIGFSSSCYAQEDALTDFLGKAKDIIVDHVKKDYKRNPELYHDLAREGIKKVGEGIKNTTANSQSAVNICMTKQFKCAVPLLNVMKAMLEPTLNLVKHTMKITM